jgi:hypothetical protein
MREFAGGQTRGEPIVSCLSSGFAFHLKPPFGTADLGAPLLPGALLTGAMIGAAGAKFRRDSCVVELSFSLRNVGKFPIGRPTTAKDSKCAFSDKLCAIRSNFERAEDAWSENFCGGIARQPFNFHHPIPQNIQAPSQRANEGLRRHPLSFSSQTL